MALIFEKLQELISDKFVVDISSVTMNTSFNDLQADSLDVVELALIIEEEFGIPEISESDKEELVTVRDVVEYIAEALD